VALIGVLWLGVAGAAGMWWWDRRPAHTPAVHLLFLTWAAPESLGAKLASSAARMSAAERNVASLNTAIADQDARIEAQSQASVVALARSEATIRDQRAAMYKAIAARTALSGPPVGANACDRAKSVDDAFLDTLK
jgi:hypothetical protein